MFLIASQTVKASSCPSGSGFLCLSEGLVTGDLEGLLSDTQEATNKQSFLGAGRHCLVATQAPELLDSLVSFSNCPPPHFVTHVFAVSRVLPGKLWSRVCEAIR